MGEGREEEVVDEDLLGINCDQVHVGDLGMIVHVGDLGIRYMSVM